MIFSLKLILMILCVIGFMMIINLILRKIFKAGKRSMSSDYCVNERHRRINRTIQFFGLGILLLQFIIVVKYDYLYEAWYSKPYNLFLFYLIFSEAVKAIMEKLYAENKKEYLVTTFQLLFTCTTIGVLYSTDFFGWFG
ncbi:DUF4181 domain-containing protein [Falsibacillus pallidus]|uniref:DUF4181 domain-containing protein n=1 Tax=Falsibacillus pallidus TaxID=493781 RepID=UPI003D998B74